MQRQTKTGAIQSNGDLLLPAKMGERSAVGPKSGESVSQSDPGLRRPTPPSTAGRKPAARPSDLLHSLIDPKSDSTTCEAEGSQRKTGQGAEIGRASCRER